MNWISQDSATIRWTRCSVENATCFPCCCQRNAECQPIVISCHPVEYVIDCCSLPFVVHTFHASRKNHVSSQYPFFCNIVFDWSVASAFLSSLPPLVMIPASIRFCSRNLLQLFQLSVRWSFAEDLFVGKLALATLVIWPLLPQLLHTRFPASCTWDHIFSMAPSLFYHIQNTIKM